MKTWREIKKDFIIVCILFAIGALSFSYTGTILRKFFFNSQVMLALLSGGLVIIFFLFFLGIYETIQRWLGKLLKYLITGFANTGIDFALLNFLIIVTGITTGIGVALFNLISFSLATLHSYFWMRFWVFESRAKMSTRQFLNFWIVTAVGGIVSSIIIFLGISLLSQGERTATMLEINAVKAIAVAAWIAINFLGYKKFIFKDVQGNSQEFANKALA